MVLSGIENPTIVGRVKECFAPDGAGEREHNATSGTLGFGARCTRTMPGLYDQNDFDGNAIIGPGADGLGNFHLLAGFSGHGLMHAPGCGRALAELILTGSYQTIDLARLGWQRLRDGTPLREQGII